VSSSEAARHTGWGRAAKQRQSCDLLSGMETMTFTHWLALLITGALCVVFNGIGRPTAG